MSRNSLSKLHAGVALTSFALGALISAPAAAAPVKFDLLSAQELTSAGWTLEPSGVTAQFSAGLMSLDVTSSAEWMLKPESNADWFANAKDASGWSIEARARLLALTGCPGPAGPGLWIHDDTNLIQFHFSTTQAGISFPAMHLIDLDTQSFHVYRIQNLGHRHMQLVIDGQLVTDLPNIALGSGTPALTFGDLGGCATSSTVWDYFAYDTATPSAPPGDADVDGIANATDNCALLSNASQADQDHDGIGDACDSCPADPKNDADGDGLCAGDDPCPDDPRNDSNKNGVCDGVECASMPAGICLPFCGCSPQGFGGYPLDNFGGFLGVDSVGGAGSASGGNSGRGGTGIHASGGASAGSFASSGSATGGNSNADASSSESTSSGCACGLPGRAGGGTLAWTAVVLALGLVVLRKTSRD